MAFTDYTQLNAESAAQLIDSGLNFDINKVFKTSTQSRTSASQKVEVSFWNKAALVVGPKTGINYTTNTGAGNALATVSIDQAASTVQTFAQGTSEQAVQDWLNAQAYNIPDAVENYAISQVLAQGAITNQTYATTAAFSIAALQTLKGAFVGRAKTIKGLTLFLSSEIYAALKALYAATPNADQSVLLTGKLPMIEGITVIETQNAGFAGAGAGVKGLLVSPAAAAIGFSIPAFDGIKTGVSASGIPLSIQGYKNGPLDAVVAMTEMGIAFNDIVNQATKLTFSA